jgi:hypothetical protein
VFDTMKSNKNQLTLQVVGKNAIYISFNSSTVMFMWSYFFQCLGYILYVNNKRTFSFWLKGLIWNLESLKCNFKHFGGEILQNSEDYKYIEDINFPRHFYLELNKLEKSPWKTGGGVSVTLFPLCDAGGRKSQCDFDQECCI